MKRLFIMILAAVAVTACKSEKYDYGTDTSVQGSISLHLSQSGSFIESKAEADVDVNTFAITLRNSNNEIVNQWARYSDFPNVLTLEKGTYTITACTPDTLPAAFDQPIFQGSQTFTVEPSKLSSINLICKLANMKVQINFTDQFKSELFDYEAVVSISQAANGILIFNGTNLGASGYFKVAPITIQVTGKRKVDSTLVEQTVTIPSVAAQDFHKITMNAIETGNAQLTITIDGTTNDKTTDIVIPGENEDGNDPSDPSQTNVPTITGNGVGSTLNYTATTAASAQIDIAVATPGSTINNLIVRIESNVLSAETLAAVGLAEQFDLANIEAGSTMETALGSGEGLGLLPSDGSSIKGKSSYSFSIGKFMPMLSVYGASNNKFHITVTDAAGKTTTKTLTVVIE